MAMLALCDSTDVILKVFILLVALINNCIATKFLIRGIDKGIANSTN